MREEDDRREPNGALINPDHNRRADSTGKPCALNMVFVVCAAIALKVFLLARSKHQTVERYREK
jgi:hypothetical protein